LLKFKAGTLLGLIENLAGMSVIGNPKDSKD